MSKTDKENDLIKVLYKKRNEFNEEAKNILAQALCRKDIEEAGGDIYVNNFCEGYFQGRVSSFTGEITSLKAELDKARELIREILGIENKNKPVIEALKDVRHWEDKAKEFLKKEGE